MQTRRLRDLVPIPEAECWGLLAEAPLARIGFSTDGGPDVLPVNHLVHDGRLVFRSAPGSKLGVAAAGSTVAIEVDEYDPESHTGWSVVAYGHAHIVTEPEHLSELHSIDFAPWTSPDLRDLWIEVDVERISGRRVEAT